MSGNEDTYVEETPESRAIKDARARHQYAGYQPGSAKDRAEEKVAQGNAINDARNTHENAALERMARARLMAKKHLEEMKTLVDTSQGRGQNIVSEAVTEKEDPAITAYKQHMLQFDAEYPQRKHQRDVENRGFIKNIQSKEDATIKGAIRRGTNALRGDHTDGNSTYENDSTSNRMNRENAENQRGGLDNSLEDTEPTANLASLTDKNNPGLGYSADEKRAAARLAAQRKMVEDAMSNNGMLESVNRQHSDAEIEGLMKGNVPFAYLHADDENPDKLSTSKEALGIDPKDWYRPRNARPNQIARAPGPGDDDSIPDEFK